jgi:hypothetical protein
MFQSPRTPTLHAGLDVFTKVTMNNSVLWNVTTCDSCKSRRFGGAYLHHQSDSELETTLAVTSNRNSVVQLLVTADVVPYSPTLVTLMMEVIRSSEMTALTRATRCNIPEDEILWLLYSFLTVQSANIWHELHWLSKRNCTFLFWEVN